MIRDIKDSFFDKRVEAKKFGHRFIKVYLHPSKIGRNQQEVIISGCVDLVGTPSGLNDRGQRSYNFHEQYGASMKFILDDNEGEFVCWLYDDQGKGYFSETGYNRDLLASHYNDNFFTINDVDVLKDVQERAEWRSAHKKDKYREGIAPKIKQASKEDLAKEIEALQKKLQNLEEIEKEQLTEKESLTEKIEKISKKVNKSKEAAAVV